MIETQTPSTKTVGEAVEWLASEAAKVRDGVGHRTPAQTLAELHWVECALHEAQVHAVARMRDANYTWANIGAVLGVTRQAAQQRYGSS